MVTREENQILEADFTEEEILRPLKTHMQKGPQAPTVFPFYFIINFGLSLRQT
jgi:hypothetical protein